MSLIYYYKEKLLNVLKQIKITPHISFYIRIQFATKHIFKYNINPKQNAGNAQKYSSNTHIPYS